VTVKAIYVELTVQQAIGTYIQMNPLKESSFIIIQCLTAHDHHVIQNYYDNELPK